MTEARLVRRVRFRAVHRYGWPDRSEAENRRVFGAQAEPHAHDWTVEVQVVGPLDVDTGFVMDLEALDRTLGEVIGGWDGGDLNELVPPVRAGHLQPSTEALARWLYGELAERLPGPARLDRVRVFESPELGAEYPA